MWLPHYLRSPALDASAAVTYATWNPSDKNASFTLSGGNLTTAYSGISTWGALRANVGKASGKWYWEIAITAINASNFLMIGIGKSTISLSSYVGSDANGWGYLASNGQKWNNATNAAYGSTYTAADKIMVALDMDNGKVWFGKNGTWQASGDPAAGTNAAYTGLSGTFYPAMSCWGAADATTANFGATAQTYSAPTGFTAGLTA